MQAYKMINGLSQSEPVACIQDNNTLRVLGILSLLGWLAYFAFRPLLASRKFDCLQDFRHKPLANPGKSIRLLVLEPSPNFDDPIVCSLKGYSLVARPSYEALSYHWGTSSRDQPIIVNGKKMLITKSLKCALRDLRYPFISRTLWADGICIDQSFEGLEERNVQVGHMMQVFSDADRVIAWLHEADLNFWDMFTFVATLAQCRPHHGHVFEAVKRFKNWKTAVVFFQLPWWTRVWVFQETVVAKEMILRCGMAELPWSIVLDGAIRFLEMDNKKDHPSNSKYGWRRDEIFKSEGYIQMVHWAYNTLRVGHFRRCRNHRKPLRLLDLLSSQRGKSHGSTNPRDRVYALLGLAVEQQALSEVFALDYRKSVIDVYTEIARASIKISGRTKILSYAGPYKTESRLPSWVPDWRFGSARQDWNRLHSTLDSINGPLFNATGSRAAETMDGSPAFVLKIRGVILDKIDSLCTSCTAGKALQFYQSFLPDDDVAGFSSWDSPHIQDELWKESTWLTEAIEKDGWNNSPQVYLDPMTFVRILCRDSWASLTRMNESIVRQSRIWLRDHGPSSRLCKALRAYKVGSLEMGREHLTCYNLLSDQELAYNYRNVSLSSYMAHTSNGYFAIVPPKESQIGDFICVLLGGAVPYVLRKEGDHYILVGEAYVHGIMDGEVMQDLENGGCQLEWISIH